MHLDFRKYLTFWNLSAFNSLHHLLLGFKGLNTEYSIFIRIRIRTTLPNFPWGSVITCKYMGIFMFKYTSIYMFKCLPMALVTVLFAQMAAGSKVCVCACVYAALSDAGRALWTLLLHWHEWIKATRTWSPAISPQHDTAPVSVSYTAPMRAVVATCMVTMMAVLVMSHSRSVALKHTFLLRYTISMACTCSYKKNTVVLLYRCIQYV